MAFNKASNQMLNSGNNTMLNNQAVLQALNKNKYLSNLSSNSSVTIQVSKKLLIKLTYKNSNSKSIYRQDIC